MLLTLVCYCVSISLITEVIIMSRIKTQEEVAKFIKEKMNDKGIKKSIDLARAVSICKYGHEMGSRPDNIDAIKYSVSKWLQWENKDKSRFPGTEYIFYLSQVLGVTMEELLMAGDVCSKYDNRPFSLYAIAKSNSPELLESVRDNDSIDGNSILSNYDEFDKTLLHYILEFDSRELLQYMIDNGYVRFENTGFTIYVTMWGMYFNTELYSKIVKMAIKYDDINIFRSAINRVLPLYKDMLDEEDMLKILDTTEIFKYLTTPYVATAEEWRMVNPGITYIDNESTEALKGVQVLPILFNNLLAVAKDSQNDKLDLLRDIAKKHNKTTMDLINRFYSRKEFEILEDGRLTSGRYGWLTVLGMEDGKVVGEGA